jgi:polyphenol oxidase
MKSSIARDPGVRLDESSTESGSIRTMKQSRELTAARLDGHWIWRTEDARTRVFFVGRGPEARLARILAMLPDSPDHVARLRQVHSSKVIQAFRGVCGEADALITDGSSLAVGVATADCLPIVLSGPQQTAAIHAGWRGLAGGIVRRTVESLTDPAEQLAAWIGPGIGPCCYEVGPDVAQEVSVASSAEVIRRQPYGKIHLDLAGTARVQLSELGVTEILTLPVCTYCQHEQLWSYRREGPRAGRNWTLAWRVPTATE